MNPEISIIVPIYNVGRYLSSCIESILNQTFKNFELILINDGSTDNSLDICNYYRLADSRIVIINKENGGQASARNKGLDIARGKYIGFVDSDDYIDRDMYEKLYNLCEQNKVDISNITYNMCYKNGYIKCRAKEDISELIIYNKKDAMKALLEGEVYDDIVWTKLFKRELFDNLRFPEIRRFEDTAIMYKLIDKAEKVCYLNESKYNYIIREDSTMGLARQYINIDNLIIYENMFKFIDENYKDLSNLVVIRIANTALLAMNRIIYNEKYIFERDKFLNVSRVLNKYFFKIIKLDYFPMKVKILIIFNRINPRWYKNCIKMIKRIKGNNFI